MLNTATALSAYQLSRMHLASPRTSKKISPSRGRGTASGSDMLPIVARGGQLVQLMNRIGGLPGTITTSMVHTRSLRPPGHGGRLFATLRSESGENRSLGHPDGRT